MPACPTRDHLDVLLPADTPPDLIARLRAAPDGETRALALVAVARHTRETTLSGAQALGEAALSEALRCNSPRAAVEALIGLSFVSASLGQQERALDTVARAQAMLEEHSLTDLLSAVLNTRALTRLTGGDVTGARQDLQDAVDLARHARHAGDHGNALVNLGWLACSSGDAKDALHHLNLLEELIHTLPDDPQTEEFIVCLHEGRANAYALLARQSQELGRDDAQRQAAQQGLMVLRAARAALQATPSLTSELLCAAHESTLLRLNGDLRGAERAARRSAQLNAVLKQQLYIEPQLCLAELLQSRGEYDAALAQYSAALDIARRQHRHLDIQRLLSAIGALHERQGRLREALDVTREALHAANTAMDRVNGAAARHLQLDRELRQARADASSWQDRLRQAEVQARQDQLTGLLNRRGLEEGLQALQFPADGARPADWSLLAVVFVDVDHFKHVNDRHSHAVGDQVLRAVGQLLAGQVRAGDLLGRYGGEEFVLVTPVRTRGRAHGLAEACRRAVEGHDWSALLPDMHLTASVGYAVTTPDRLPQALRIADDHLYRAKNAGRNRVSPAAP
ncbi:tetratricopeptide repeat-containing diguanylate cyclase [Deinococcus sp. JMULE3]|uniref:tetratricopeptide repeat-containing diguanylate cyclase n=1 Tax=Deinococcus sp. JMULE3 TaxID=2518341 RepID=UPI0015751E83|nr:tetratricopeptide repeat-containing diguanylate cyclase [Deinococcus sp. JMULE3]